jgi:Tol biopolymer transport system component
MNPDIYSLPLNPNQGKVLGSLERLTRDAGWDDNPSITADGKKMTYFSRGGETWIMDLETGKESALTAIGANMIRTRALISSDGTKAFYSVITDSTNTFHILDLVKNTHQERITDRKMKKASRCHRTTRPSGTNSCQMTL